MWVETASRNRHGSKAGQSLIESCIVIALTCLIFLGMFQVSQLFAAKEVLNYAAGRGARARTVGFNSFMVDKTVRVGSIPNAGRMTSPVDQPSPSEWSSDTPEALWTAWFSALQSSPASQQYATEKARIPLYLGSQSYGQLSAILDYKDWPTVAKPNLVENDAMGTLVLKVYQLYPLRFPLHRTFYADDNVELEGRMNIENHYPLYIANQDGG
jgi:hypothetical protein